MTVHLFTSPPHLLFCFFYCFFFPLAISRLNKNISSLIFFPLRTHQSTVLCFVLQYSTFQYCPSSTALQKHMACCFVFITTSPCAFVCMMNIENVKILSYRTSSTINFTTDISVLVFAILFVFLFSCLFACGVLQPSNLLFSPFCLARQVMFLVS